VLYDQELQDKEITNMSSRKVADPLSGRKKANKNQEKKKARRDVDSDDESVVSVMTSSSEEIGEDSIYKAEDTCFADTVEQLTEKRGSVRVSALKSLIDSLTSQMMDEQITNRSKTIELYLTRIIRQGGSEEVTHACRLLSLIILTIGSDIEEAGKSFLPVLSTIIKNSSKPASSRRACIQAMGTIGWILCSPQETTESMSLLEQISLDTKTDPTIAAQAITIWSLLASTCSEWDLGTTVYAKYLPLFTKLLEHKDLEVRSAAGEAIALLYSANLNVETMNEDEKEKKKFKPKFKPDLTTLTELVQALAKEGSKHIQKKEKVKQRSLFRDVVATIEDGVDPSEKITIGKKKYEFVGWGQVKQLALVREILGTGFALHFAQNDLLLDIFNVTKEEPDSGKRDKKLDRAMRQEKEKTSCLEKGKQRKKKNAFQEELYHDE